LIRRISRLAIVLPAVVIFSAILAGCGPSIPGPYTIERAQQMEKEGRLEESLQMYHYVVQQNQRSNPPLAAKALYEGGLFAQDKNRYGKTPERLSSGLSSAEQMWRQLRDEFPTPAKAMLLIGAPGDKYRALADKIDERNRKDWKYQIIDNLVKVSGGQGWSYGLALVMLAFIVKLLLFPLTRKQYAAQREMQRMQPLIKELQKKFKGAELSQKQMALYKEHGVNPFAGCVPTLFQLPFLILVFTAIREYEHRFAQGTFLWIGSPIAAGNPSFLGTSLAMPDVPLLAMYALTNYITMRLSPAADPQQQQQQNTMALMTSVIFFWMFLSYKWSSAFVLYWLALNLISIWQQYHYIYQPHKQRQATGEILPAPGTSGNGAGSVTKDAAPIAKPRQAERVRPRKKKK
jgi:YidC/Oxa1 family membrane protein insertase